MKKIKFKKILLSISLIMIVALCASAAPKKVYLKLDKKKLLSGEIQIFVHKFNIKGKGKKKRVIGVLLIDAPPGKVWRVLLNWDAMGAYVPSLKYYKTIRVLKPSGKGRVGISLIEGSIKAAFITITYTLKVKFDEPNLRQEWNLVTDEQVKIYNKKNIKVKKSSAGVKNIEGFEYLEPYDGGKKTIYYYAPIVEVSIPAPDFIERSMSKSSFREYMLGVKKKVKSLK